MAKTKQSGEGFFVIAHNIRSLYNIGSIFRTADAFGVSKLYLTGYTASPEGMSGDRIAKTALGAENAVPWEHWRFVSRLIAKLKSQGVRLVALENNLAKEFGSPLSLKKYKPGRPLALVLGEEVGGVPKPVLRLCDEIVEIPMLGKKESLNVSVAFGIAACHIAWR